VKPASRFFDDSLDEFKVLSPTSIEMNAS